MDKDCELCGKKCSRIVNHHLSYEPEIIIQICYKCHIFIHSFALYSRDQIKKVGEWVNQFSDQWVNGIEKYAKSECRKKVRKEWADKNREKLRGLHKKWTSNNKEKVKEYRKKQTRTLRKVNPDYYKKYHQMNREKHNEANRRWKQKNPDYNKEYQLKNAEKLRIQKRKYRLEHRESFNANRKRWRNARGKCQMSI